MNKALYEFYKKNEKVGLVLAVGIGILFFIVGLIIGQSISPATIVKVQCQNGDKTSDAMTLTQFFDYVLSLQFPPLMWGVIIVFIIILIK